VIRQQQQHARMQRFEPSGSTRNTAAMTTTTTTTTTTRNIAKQMMMQANNETPTTSSAISSDIQETPGLDLRRHSLSNPPTTGRFR